MRRPPIPSEGIPSSGLVIPSDRAVSRDVLRADVEVELGVDGVDGVGRGLGDAHPTLTGLGVVDGPGLALAPVWVEGDRARAVVEGPVGVDPLLQGGRQDERLEGGARLAMAVGGDVELVGGVVGGRRHREHVAGGHVGRHQRGRGATEGCGAVVDRRLRQRLQARVERGVDTQVTLTDRPHPVAADQLLLDVVEEVGILDRGVAPAQARARAPRPRRAGAGGR